MSDPSNPSHPEPLTDDPRFSGLPASVVDAAKEATCTRCGEQIVESKAMQGTVMVNYYVPALGVRQRGILCGLCGLRFWEFLVPAILEDPRYQEARDELQRRFS